mgnify:CR=1 FL=1
MDTKPRNPLTKKDLKAAAGALVVLMALLFLVVVLMGNWCAAVLIPVAFVAGAMAIGFSAQADGVNVFPAKDKSHGQ